MMVKASAPISLHGVEARLPVAVTLNSLLLRCLFIRPVDT